MPDVPTEGEKRDFVIVRLDDEYFAFDIADIAEVFPFTEPVLLPHAPHFLAGVIDVRRNMLPVVDLRRRAELGLGARPRHIIAVRLHDRFIGAIVDEVCEVYAAEESAVVRRAALADKLDPQYARYALYWGKRLTPVMDAVRLLTTGETLRLKHPQVSPRRRRGERSYK